MSDDAEIVDESGSQLPSSWAVKVPKKLHGVTRELLDLPAKERGKIFKVFNQPQSREAGRGSSETVQRVEASMWQGPLPSPDQLARFNEIVPDAAERLIRMAENQQAHRLEIESHVIRNQVTQSSRGQIFGLIIGLAGISLAGFVAYLGLAVAAGTIGSVTLGGLAVAFITGKAQEKNSRAKKQ